MGFSRQEYWSGLPCPPPGDLPDPRTEPLFLKSPALAGTFFTTSATWEALDIEEVIYKVPSDSWLISKLYINNNSRKHKKKRAAGKLKDRPDISAPIQCMGDRVCIPES